jgi:ATP-dependent DNA ligase
MTLPIAPPYEPMEATSVAAIPIGSEWQYEPKWDGFRCLVFRDGLDVELQSKSGRPLTRYYPELVDAVRDITADAFVVDGEIVVPEGKAFSFDALLQRIHPAQSRVRKLAIETPALLILFDMLVAPGGKLITAKPLPERRQALEGFYKAACRDINKVRLSPTTVKLDQAKDWLKNVGKTLDGIIAKRRDLGYRAGERNGMQKIKNYRSADCVVGGFRFNRGSSLVGSLLLGLYDDAGLLHHVGFTSAIKQGEKAALTKKLTPLIGPPGFTGNAPGGPSRWSTERSGEWTPLKPKLVVEVGYDHFSGGRFRHGTQIIRWRPDKSPRQCTMDKVEQTRANLFALLK